MAAIVTTVTFRAGANAGLPAAAAQGEPLWVTDTQELYVGTGASRVKVGSAAIGAGTAFSVADKTKLDNLPAFVAADETKLDAITSTGSGAIITTVERTNLTANTAAIAALATTYQARAEKGAANGYAPLDATSRVPSANLPAVALTDVRTHATIAARDADLANMQSGDVSVVTAESKTYMVDQAGTGFVELASPGLAGVTFNGRAGPALAPANGDYNAGQITVTPAGNLAANTAAGAFTELQGDIDALTAATAGISATTATDVADNTAARHTHAVPAAVPNSLGTANQVWATNAGATAGEWQSVAAGVSTFAALTDTDALVATTLLGANAAGSRVISYDGVSGGTF